MKKVAVTLESLDQKIDSGLKHLDQKIDSGLKHLDQKIDSGLKHLDQKIETSIEFLDKKIDTKFDYLDNKIDTKFDSLDKKIDTKFDQLFDFLSENIMMRPEVEKVIEENNQKMVSQVQTTLEHYSKQYKNTDEEVLILQHRVTLIEKHVGL